MSKPLFSIPDDPSDDSASSPAGPKIDVMYVAPGHAIITPAEVEGLKTEEVIISGAKTLARISPTVMVKYGTHASLIEAKSMLFVSEHCPSIPIPKIYAAYTYGPLKRNLIEHGTLYDTYIFMDYVEGETLEEAWKGLDPTAKANVSAELRQHMEQLRSIPSADYIGSVERGPITDMILEWHSTFKGPFESETEFNATIEKAFVSKTNGFMGTYVRTMLDSLKHEIKFSHGDFRPANIIYRDGHVVSILDWELAGWYPEYWEFVKAYYIEHFATDWGLWLLEILKPYFSEEAMFGRITSILW